MPQPKVHPSHAHRQAAYRRRCQEAARQQLKEKALPALPTISTIPGIARWRQAVANATQLLSATVQEMETYYDDRSEEWQESERGEDFRERLDTLCEARDALAELTTI
jgi:hypothetical protein